MATEFAVKDCALATLAVGHRVQTLRELRDGIRQVPAESIYHHFWGALLHPKFFEREYNNDFAAWAYRALHDQRLAERMAVIDPTEFVDLEDLRAEVLDVIDERLDESELVPTASLGEQFHFLRSIIVVFDTGVRLSSPDQLAPAVAAMTTGSVFYHFIDARRRTPLGLDDFRAWLLDAGPQYEALYSRLAGVDPYFDGLPSLRQRLAAVFAEAFSLEEPS
ncbi:MAG: hypothetical protein GX536_03195 [Actinobacteria bacterium]|nr:hypothetical protein [Actinomycetota bacterium]